MSRQEIAAAIARHSESELLVDQPYEDRKKVRVTGRFTVESLSPHRVLDAERPPPTGTEVAAASWCRPAARHARVTRHCLAGRAGLRDSRDRDQAAASGWPLRGVTCGGPPGWVKPTPKFAHCPSWLSRGHWVQTPAGRQPGDTADAEMVVAGADVCLTVIRLADGEIVKTCGSRSLGVDHGPRRRGQAWRLPYPATRAATRTFRAITVRTMGASDRRGVLCSSHRPSRRVKAIPRTSRT